MPAAYTEWTVDLLDALPESSERFDLIDGDLYVTPSPGLPHQGVVLLLASRLREFCRRIGIGQTVISPSDVRRGDVQKNRVQPDIYVVRKEHGSVPSYPFQLDDLLLAVEVASPSNPFLDYHVKRELYLGEQVGGYWIVDIERRAISRWRSTGEPGDVLTDRLEWRPAGATESFVVDIPALFDESLE